MTGREVARRILKLGGEQVRQRGSHMMMRIGECRTVVPIHLGRDLPKGTLRSIERDLEPCLGKGWLR